MRSPDFYRLCAHRRRCVDSFFPEKKHAISPRSDTDTDTREQSSALIRRFDISIYVHGCGSLDDNGDAEVRNGVSRETESAEGREGARVLFVLLLEINSDFILLELMILFS